MKKMLVIIIALTFVLLFAGCLQQQYFAGDGNKTSTAQICMKTPNRVWCDNEQKCIDPDTEVCR